MKVWPTGLSPATFGTPAGAWHGSTLAPGQEWFNTGLEGSSNINSQIYGFQIACTENLLSGGCYPPWLDVAGAQRVRDRSSKAPRTRRPYVTGQGSLWTTGSYVWNPPGDSWPVTPVRQRRLRHLLLVSDRRQQRQLNGPSEPRDTTVWQQCPNPVSWSFPVDTRSQVPTDGSFQIALSATNAAGVGRHCRRRPCGWTTIPSASRSALRTTRTRASGSTMRSPSMPHPPPALRASAE